MYQILGIISLIATIWVIYDVWAKTSKSTGIKVVWTIAALLFGIITAIIYYFVGKEKT